MIGWQCRGGYVCSAWLTILKASSPPPHVISLLQLESYHSAPPSFSHPSLLSSVESCHGLVTLTPLSTTAEPHQTRWLCYYVFIRRKWRFSPLLTAVVVVQHSIVFVWGERKRINMMIGGLGELSVLCLKQFSPSCVFWLAGLDVQYARSLTEHECIQLYSMSFFALKNIL